MKLKRSLALVVALLLIMPMTLVSAVNVSNALPTFSVNTVLVEQGAIPAYIGNIENTAIGNNLIIDPKDFVAENPTFPITATITLKNAEWYFVENLSTMFSNWNYNYNTYNINNGSLKGNIYTRTASSENTYKLTLTDYTNAILEITAADFDVNKLITIPLVSKLTGAGNATATIVIKDDNSKIICNKSLTFATSTNKYTYDVPLSVKNIQTLINGSYNNETTQKTGLITAQENYMNSWLTWSTIQFNLPEQVKISRIEIVSSKGFTSDLRGTYWYGNINGNIVINESSFTIYNSDPNRTDRIQVEFYLWLSIESGYEGDIDLAMGNSNRYNYYDNYYSDNSTITIAKSKNPVTVTTTITEAKKEVETDTAKIFITEANAGIFKRNNIITITLPQIKGVTWNNDIKINVTKGNLNISDVKIDNGVITFRTNRASTMTSTIELSNIKANIIDVALETTEAQTLSISGIDIAANVGNSRDQFIKGELATNYLKILPADKKIPKTTVIFTPGSKIYTINGVKHTMDVAPYVKGTKIMVPLRFVSEALDAEVYWGQETQTVSILLNNNCIQFINGSTKFYINDKMYEMDTALEMSNDRTFVSSRFLGYALNVLAEHIDGNAVYTIE